MAGLLAVLVAGAVHTLPAGRADESQLTEQPEDELERLVSRIRSRVIDELGLSHTVVRVSVCHGMRQRGGNYQVPPTGMSSPKWSILDQQPVQYQSIIRMGMADRESLLVLKGSKMGSEI